MYLWAYNIRDYSCLIATSDSLSRLDMSLKNAGELMLWASRAGVIESSQRNRKGIITFVTVFNQRGDEKFNHKGFLIKRTIHLIHEKNMDSFSLT